MKTVNINISLKSIILSILFGVLLIALYISKDVILLLFASFIISSALMPSVDWLSKKMRRGWAVTIVFLIMTIVILTIFVPFFMILTDQTQEFIKQLPNYVEYLEKSIYNLKIISSKTTLLPDASNIINQASSVAREIINQSINITLNVFTGLVASFTVFTIVLFILLEKNELKELFLSFFPPKMRDKTEEISINIAHRVGGYVRGQLFIMLAVGLVTAIGLLMLNVKFSLLLGLLAGLFEIVPIVGPIFATFLAVLVAIVQSPMQALYVLILFLLIQRLQNSFLSPVIYGRMLDLNPLLIIIALLFCATTLGAFGAILSPAIAAALYVLVQELYLKKINKNLAKEIENEIKN